ncbi:hypothetical protein [Sphingomonas sp.]|uniref:hypothetical protein n=1 Tax=Sphingomonas sp. TaxID=28214 RepID=UPI003AFF7EF1
MLPLPGGGQIADMLRATLYDDLAIHLGLQQSLRAAKRHRHLGDERGRRAGFDQAGDEIRAHARRASGIQGCGVTQCGM